MDAFPSNPILANIYGGTFDNNFYGLFTYNTTANVYGGSFENNSVSGIIADTGGIVNVYGGNFANNVGAFDLEAFASNASITVYGSDFTQNGVALPYGTLGDNHRFIHRQATKRRHNANIQLRQRWFLIW